MLTKKAAFKNIISLERKINHLIEKGKYNDALALISICAQVLYTTNLCYTSDTLEDFLKTISKKINLNNFKNNEQFNDDTVLFYDGFGLNDRGLIRIYLQAISKIKKLVYVTYLDRKEEIPDIIEFLEKSNNQICFLKRDKNLVEVIKQLDDLIKGEKPRHMFFYSYPEDVVGPTVMYSYENIINRYQINLTDHAFWLGSKCIDRCIEFRDYGAKISKEYRKIEDEKIVKIPFYPHIDREKEFKGFPFNVENKKVIFSGGSLYKTFSKDNKYYNIVEYILNKYPEVVFWYAGIGDSTKIKELVNKYPNRVFFTGERADLFQVLEHCRLYLSTYPIPGGLMFQYAALAGCVPATLKRDNITEGFLLNQKGIDIEFENEEDLYNEIDKIITDDNYFELRKEIMKKSVISPTEFDYRVTQLLLGNIQECKDINDIATQTEEFREVYLENYSYLGFLALFAKKHDLKIALKYYPFRTIISKTYILGRKLLGLDKKR